MGIVGGQFKAPEFFGRGSRLLSLKINFFQNPKNGHNFLKKQNLEKITTLYFLKLLKLKKRKWAQNCHFWLIWWDKAIFSLNTFTVESWLIHEFFWAEIAKVRNKSFFCRNISINASSYLNIVIDEVKNLFWNTSKFVNFVHLLYTITVTWS